MLKCLLFLFIGLFVGCVLGIGVMCLAHTAGQADKEHNGEERD
ncbi:MAG: DUF3789 domain-containing protein [Lachnospiraceae bacterium]